MFICWGSYFYYFSFFFFIILETDPPMLGTLTPLHPPIPETWWNTDNHPMQQSDPISEDAGCMRKKYGDPESW